MRKYFLFLLCTIFVYSAQAQTDSSYNPLDFFSQSFNPPPGNPFRSAKGVPGPMYWQNSADYIIHATLNEKDTTISGDVTITYTNNSPDKLDYLWLQLDQNIFKQTSKAVATTKYPGDYFGVLDVVDGGYKMKDVAINYGGKSYTVEPIVTDTRMQIRLQTPMNAKGDKVSIKINFSFKIPVDGAGRFGRQETKNGIIYQIGQWYPRMCVYNNIKK